MLQNGRSKRALLQSEKAYNKFARRTIVLCLLSGIILMLARSFNPVEDGWQKTTARNVNMNEGILQNLVERFHEGYFGHFDGLVIIKDNMLVIDEYENGYNSDRIHTVQSDTKSITSLLIGIAIDQGDIQDEDVKVLDYFQESAIENMDDRKKAITVKDLLTMRGGFDWDEFSSEINADNPVMKMNNSPNWVKCAMNAPMKYKPGTRFQYNSGGVMILDDILKKETGMHSDQYAEKQLFSRLGIHNYFWSKQYLFFGTAHTGGGLYLRPRDLAKIGQLILNKGQWNGEQIISREWIAKSLEKQVGSVNLGIVNTAYGYLWWLFPDKNALHVDIYTCIGNGGQYMFVIPQYNLVAVTTGNEFNDRFTALSGAMDMLYNYILKSVE